MVLSYANDGSPVTSAGLGTEEGLILARHHVEGCSRITAASIFLTNSAADNEMYAVVLDQNGTILDTSAAYTPGVNETGNWHSFFFSDPPELNNEDFYIGIAQTAGMNAYHPVGVQWETPYIRDSAYFRADIDASNLIHHPTPGRLMIRSHISHAMPSPVIEGDLTLCENDTNTLSVASLDLRYATSVTGVSSEYSAIQYSASQALGSPDVFPGSGGDPKAWASSTLDGQREYLELGFVDAGPVNRIVIYETYNPGAVDSVFVRNPLSGNFELVYSATAESLGIPSNALTIDFPMTAFDVSEIRIALNSPAVSGFNSIDAVGIGQYDDSPGYASYLWGPNGETTSSIQVSAPGSYSVVVTDNNGCDANTSVDVITPDGTIPVITAESETDFCEGGFVILTSDQSAGNVWSTGETTQQISVDESGSYYVSYDDGTGCGLVNSNTIEVTVHPLPVVSINGILAICPGGTTTLDAGTYSEYLWSTSATTQTIEVSAIGSYSVTVTDANGCTGFASVNVVDAPELEPEISGNQTFCLGSSTLLDAGEYETYLWNTGAITQTITVTIPGVYSVTVEDSNGCSGDADITTFGLEPPAPSISGDAGFCPGGEATLDAGPGFVTYAWSQGSANQMITVDAASSYSVTVTDGNGCSGEDAQMVVEFTPPQPVIAGTLSFCAGSTTQLDAGHGYASYLWSTGEITQTIVVDTTDTFSVTVTDNNGCTGEDSATTTNEGAIPESPGPISGPTSGLCGSENVEYSILPVENAAFYVWTIPENATIVSGQGTTTIIVDFDTDFTSGDIVVAASNACGQSPSIDPTFITVSGVPETPDEITGPDSNVCPGDIVEYSVVEVPFATEYSWTVPMNAQITSGQNTPSITVEILNGFSGGDVCVAAGNTCGESMPLCITIINGDMDDDGIPDCLDNCPEVFNPNQKDKDHDGVGDACDPCNNNHQGGSCDDGDPCTINDELDAFCVCQGTYVDSDNDGICDAFDICPGFDDEIDSDGDGVPDGCDECPGYDDNLDENGNGIPDDCDFCTTVDVDAGDCEFVYYGYMPLACTMLEASATSGTAPFTYLWSNGATSQTPNVCPATTTVYTVTVTDANGCTGTDDVTVEAIDVRCGPGNKNVELCHFNSSDNTYTTICVKANQVPSHLNHGDELGECGITPCSGGMAYMGNSLHHDPDTWESSGFLNATNNSMDHTGSLQVYPNPARNEISITGLVYNLVPPRSRIIDMQGRSSIVELVPASNSSIWKLDVSLLNDGVYILEVLQDGTRHHVRLVITR